VNSIFNNLFPEIKIIDKEEDALITADECFGKRIKKTKEEIDHLFSKAAVEDFKNKNIFGIEGAKEFWGEDKKTHKNKRNRSFIF